MLWRQALLHSYLEQRSFTRSRKAPLTKAGALLYDSHIRIIGYIDKLNS
jgi:hypothetical protein